MIDQAIERQYSDTKELLALWNTFHQFFSIGVKGEAITPEKESQFLELKSRIAMLHDSFMEALTANQNIGQDVLNVITRAITLKQLNRLSTADTKKLEIEWHEVYLLLNDTIAVLEQKRRDLDDINESQFKAKRAAGLAKQKVGNFFGSFYFKLFAIIVAVLFVTIGIQTLGVYDYDDLGKISSLRTPYNWGKAAVRVVVPDSPWPTIDSMYRKPHSGWPGGLLEAEVDSEVTTDEAAANLARMMAPTGIGAQVGPMLQKAVESKKETASKQRGDGVDIYTFRFADADQAKAVEDLWTKTERQFASQQPGPPIIGRLDMVRSVNVLTILESANPELTLAMKLNVYGQEQ